MRIVYMGTPDFAVPTLKALLNSPHQVVGVFSQPDRPKGRGYQLVAPPVKELALAHNIPVYQPEKMRDGTALEILKGLRPDGIVVAAYGRILPKEILELPPYGCINVHASLLPQYRGAGPVQWSVINGEETTGVTTMFMGEGLDTGDLLEQVETPIGQEETAGELMDRLAELGAGLLLHTLELLESGKAVRTVQDESKVTYAPMLKKKDGALDFSKPAKKLYDQIRGVSPWPGAYAYLDSRLLKIHKAAPLPERVGEIGMIQGEKRLIVGCGEGSLELLEVQPEGGKRMRGEDFLRGRRPGSEKKFTTCPSE
ncbi:MAG: methionyl-tRNA formyltransferase [Oscillospiraceae bacterium]|nr:methionyl-tRNA formyltransferase [Oscillospiraceae bacterium]